MPDRKSRIYLSSPHMGGQELNFIYSAFEKNWIAPLGENVDEFEKALSVYAGRKHAAAVTSGTAALHLAMILCDVNAGDEVICQSFTFAASANPIRYQGAKPIFIDSESNTWNMDPVLLEDAILDRIKIKGSKPKAIVVVHLYGMPAQMKDILEVAAKYSIAVIEDAAEALGSSISGQRCGSFGRFSVLSFNGNKIITTSGGGALLGDQSERIEKARFLATQARDEAPHYQHSELGYNYRMSNILAGIGRGQMQVLDQRIQSRRANHDYYFKAFNGSWFNPHLKFTKKHSIFDGQKSANGLYFLKEPDGFYSNRWLTTILVNPDETGGISKEDLYIALAKENIESRPLWKPMHLQPLYSKYPFYGNGFSQHLFNYGLCLPSGSNLEEKQKRRVVSVIMKTLSQEPVHSVPKL